MKIIPNIYCDCGGFIVSLCQTRTGRHNTLGPTIPVTAGPTLRLPFDHAFKLLSDPKKCCLQIQLTSNNKDTTMDRSNR